MVDAVLTFAHCVFLEKVPLIKDTVIEVGAAFQLSTSTLCSCDELENQIVPPTALEKRDQGRPAGIILILLSACC